MQKLKVVNVTILLTILLLIVSYRQRPKSGTRKKRATSNKSNNQNFKFSTIRCIIEGCPVSNNVGNENNIIDFKKCKKASDMASWKQDPGSTIKYSYSSPKPAATSGISKGETLIIIKGMYTFHDMTSLHEPLID